MAIKEFIKKTKFNLLQKKEPSIANFLRRNWHTLSYTLVLISFFVIYSYTLSHLNNKSLKNEKNLEIFFKTGELLDIKKSYLSSLESPYSEFKYKIENNDSIEKILNKFRVNTKEINLIIEKLREKKLTNIYAGRELSIILKKSTDSKNTIVSILYPINNTLSVEIRKKKINLL